MDLSIVRIIDHGDPSSERIILRATKDTNLHSYALCDNTYKSDTEELSNERRNFFWFPKTFVKKDEYVRLWTKNGKYKKQKFEDGADYWHEFYWGLPGGVWNNDGDLAVLIEIGKTKIRVVSKVKKQV